MSNHEYQRTYFGTRSLPRMAIELSGTPYVQRHVDVVLSALGVPGDARVLDIGCGPGKYSAAMADRGLDVTGLDLTPELVEALSAARPDISARVGSAEDPPADLHGAFDAATGFFFLHHVDDLTAVFAGARQTLAPGGRAAFLEPNPAYLPYYAQITLTPGMRWQGERGMLDITPRNLASHARDAGFADCAVSAFGSAPPRIYNTGWGRRVDHAIDRLPGWSRVGAFRLVVLS